MAEIHPRIGFHTAGSGGNPRGIGDKYVKRAHDARRPVVIACADGFVGIGDALANPHPDDVLIFRVVRKADESYAVPDYNETPEKAAAKYWNLISPSVPKELNENKDKIWLAYGNELDQDRADWIFAWSEQMARLLNGLGYKAVGPNWAAGTPDYPEWETTAAGSFLRYCADNLDKSAVGIHEYSYTADDLFHGDGHKVGRFRHIIRVCQQNGINRPTILIKEFGYSNVEVPSPSKIVEELDRLFQRYPDYPPAALWWLGPWFGKIANQLVKAIGPVGDFVATKSYEYDESELPVAPTKPPEVKKPPVEQPKPKVKKAPKKGRQRGIELDFFKLLAGESDFRIHGKLWCDFRYHNRSNGDVPYAGMGIAVHKWTGQEWVFYYYQHSYGGRKSVLRTEGGPAPGGGEWRDHYKPDDVGIFALTPYLTFDPDAHKNAKRRNPTSISEGFHMGRPAYVQVGSHIEVGKVLRKPPKPLFTEPDLEEEPTKKEPKETDPGPDTKAPPTLSVPRPAVVQHTIWLLPPDADEQTFLALTKARFVDKTAFTWSADVVHAVIEDGASGSKCIVVDGDQWPADIYAWLAERRIPYERFESGRKQGGWPNLDPVTFEPVFGQRDPLWGKAKLGGFDESPETIGSWGCLGVAYTMMVNFLGLTDETPDKFINGSMVRAGGMSKHVTVPGAISAVFPHQLINDGWLAQEDARMIGRIKAYLDSGYPVPARVDFKPNTERQDQHWVLLIGYDGDDWIMADPWHGRVLKVRDAYDIEGQDILEALFYHFKDQPKPKDPDGVSLQPPRDTKPAVTVRYRGTALPVKPFRGLHGRSTRHPRPSDHEAFKRGGFNAILVQSGVTAREIQDYGAKFVLCRIFETFHNRTRSAPEFVRDVENDVAQAYNAGVRYFFAGNEPNLDYENPVIKKGDLGIQSGKQYARWLLEVHGLLRAKFPEIKLGWPALSPGGETPVEFGHDRGFREADASFMNTAKKTPIFDDCDFITCHAYYTSWQGIAKAVDEVLAYRNTFRKKLVFVTESTNPSAPPVDKLGKQMKEFYRRCDSIKGVGVFFYLSSGPGWSHSALVDEEDNDRGVLAHLLAK